MQSETLERRHALVRTEILTSAAKTFAKKGFHGTSVDEIARQAGLSPSALYRYFPGKDALYRGVITHITAAVLAPFDDPLLNSLNFTHGLEWLIRRQLAVVEANREFWVTFTHERASTEWQMTGEVGGTGESYTRWAHALQGFLAREGSSVSPKLNIKDAAYFLTGAISTTVFRWLNDDLPVSLQEFVPTLVRLVLGGIGENAGFEKEGSIL